MHIPHVDDHRTGRGTGEHRSDLRFDSVVRYGPAVVSDLV